MERRITLTKLASVAFAAGLGCTGFSAAARAAEKKVDFAAQIKPIFEDSCIKCHTLDNAKHKAASKFSLDTRADALKGGENGKDIIPGNGKDSLLYKLLLGPVKVDGDDVDAMPKPKHGQRFRKLPENQIKLIKDWIDQGAKWD